MKLQELSQTGPLTSAVNCQLRDGSTWSKFGARGEHGERGEDGKHGDVLRFSTEVISGSPT